jgi:enoyl-CoA hydratase
VNETSNARRAAENCWAMADPQPVGYEAVHYRVSVAGQVATIELIDAEELPAHAATVESHWELAQLLWKVAFDDSVRVVVLTGSEAGFLCRKPASDGREIAGPGRREPHWMWRVSTGIIRMHYAIALLDKPVVAKVTGDALGIGSSLVFASDLVVAREDVRIVDNHLGMGEVSPFRWRMGAVPGDGGATLAPMHFSPMRAKEYLMLARIYTAREMADLGIINWALPGAEVAAKVDELVAALLRRPAYALAWTRRIANKPQLDRLNASIDSGIAHTLLNMLEFVQEGHDFHEL